MAKRTTKSSSSAATGTPLAGTPQEEAAPATVIAEPASGPAGESVPAGNHNPESASGAVAGEASAEPVKPQDDVSQTGAMVAEAVTGAPTPEAETAASGSNSEPSQGDAAEGAGANAGPASLDDVLVVAGVETVDALLRYADLGKRFSDQFADLGVAPSAWLDAYAKRDAGSVSFAAGGVVGIDLASHAVAALNARAVSVKADRDGFRRAGFVHSKAGHTFQPGELTVDQLEAFRADPALTVEEL